MAKTLTPPTRPPLCPGTPDIFWVDDGVEFAGLRMISRDPGDGDPLVLCAKFPADRRLIARYQACAWMDRAARWADLWTNAIGSRSESYWIEYNTCMENVTKWREWEKEKA